MACGEEIIEEGNALTKEGAVELLRRVMKNEPENIILRRQPDVTVPYEGTYYINAVATEYDVSAPSAVATVGAGFGIVFDT